MEQQPLPCVYVVVCETFLPTSKAEALFYSAEEQQCLEYAEETARRLAGSLDDWNCLATLENEENAWNVIAQYTGVLWNSSPQLHSRLSVQKVGSGYYGKV